MEKKASRGRPFPAGTSGNPGGRPKLPEELKHAKRITQIELERVLNEFLFLTTPELNERLSSSSATQIERIVGVLIERAAETGDHQRLGFLLDRLVGRVADRIETFDAPKPMVLYLSSEGRAMTSEGVAIDPAMVNVLQTPKPTVIKRRDGSQIIIGAVEHVER